MDKQSWNAKYEGVHIQGDEGFHSGTNSEEGAGGGGDHAQYVEGDLNPEQRPKKMLWEGWIFSFLWDTIFFWFKQDFRFKQDFTLPKMKE